MPFGIPGGVINAPGNPYNGQLVQTTFVNLSRAAQNPATRDQAVADLRTLSALPQFHGFGWQGLLNFASVAAPGAIGALGGLGAAAGAGGIGAGTGGTVAGLGGIGGSGLTIGDLIGLGTSVAGSVAGNTAGARTSTSTPTLNPEYQSLADMLRQQAMARLAQSGDISGLTASGISGINDAYKGITQSIGNSLTNRGLANSPVAGAATTNTNLARAGDITQFLNKLPLLQQQLQTTDFNNAGNILNRNTGVTGVGAGSALGAGLNDLSGYLGYLNRLKQLGNAPAGGGIPTSTDTTSGATYPY